MATASQNPRVVFKGLSANLDGLGDRSQVSGPRRLLGTPGPTTNPSSVSAIRCEAMSFLERLFRHSIKAGSVLIPVAVPASGVPQFQMVLHADEAHVMPQAGEGNQPIRQQNSAVAIYFDSLHAGEKQSLEDNDLAMSGRGLIDFFRQPIQLARAEEPETLIQP